MNPSIAAVERALAWYLAEAPAAPAPPLPVETVRQLRAAFDGGRAGSPELFETFVAFGSVMHRLALLSPGVPACNVGDVLATLSTLAAEKTPAWPFDPNVDADTFAKLGFAATSKGIALSEHNNREGWRTHADHARALIERAVLLPARRKLALVLGVGGGFDLPLETLASTFERLVLVDVDRAPVDAVVARLRAGPSVAARLEVRALDLTGINRAIVASLDAILAGPGDRDGVQSRLEAHARAYCLAEPPSLLGLGPGERADLVVSSCVLTQLAWPQRAYAHQGFVNRFGAREAVAERSWSRAWASFELRVQQDHVDGLARAGEVGVLISDTTNHLTAFDAAGTERVTGHKVAALGVESLVERVTRASRVEDHAQWWWPRHRPGPRGEPGSLMAVEGVILH